MLNENVFVSCNSQILNQAYRSDSGFVVTPIGVWGLEVRFENGSF